MTFEQRRAHLAPLSNEELKARFWALADQVVDPLVQLSHDYTSPSVERSVLLRMGFSSLEAKAIVAGVVDLELLGFGAGHVVLRLAKALNLPYLEAGRAFAAGEHRQLAASLFAGGPR